ncbi:hypothetical protein [Celeribacter baekdonensis]|nr:hypothetical protein [Celeribacter baekdonensis]
MDITDKRKPIWWDIWNASLKAEGLPPLDPKDRSESQSGALKRGQASGS